MIPINYHIEKLRKQPHLQLQQQKSKTHQNKFNRNSKDLHLGQLHDNNDEKLEDDTNTCKHRPYSWTGRTNTVKMSVWPKAIYGLNAASSQKPMAYFTELKQIILKFTWNQKSP